MLLKAYVVGVLHMAVNFINVYAIDVYSFHIYDKYGEDAELITDNIWITLNLHIERDCDSIPQPKDILECLNTQFYISDANHKLWEYGVKDCNFAQHRSRLTVRALPPGEYLVGIGKRYNVKKYAEDKKFTIPQALIGDDHEACLQTDEFCDAKNGPWFFYETKVYPVLPTNACKHIKEPGLGEARYMGNAFPGHRYCPINKHNLLESLSTNYAETLYRTELPSCGDGRSTPRFEYLGRVLSYREAIPVLSPNDTSLKIFCPNAEMWANCAFYKEWTYEEGANNPNLGVWVNYHHCHDGRSITLPKEYANNSDWQVLKVQCSVYRKDKAGSGGRDYVEAMLVVYGKLEVKKDKANDVSYCQPHGKMKAPFRIDSMWWTNAANTKIKLGSTLTSPDHDDFVCRALISAKLCVPYWRHVAEVSDGRILEVPSTEPGVTTTSNEVSDKVTHSFERCNSGGKAAIWLTCGKLVVATIFVVLLKVE